MSMHFKASIYCTNDSYGGIQQLPNTVAKRSSGGRRHFRMGELNDECVDELGGLGGMFAQVN